MGTDCHRGARASRGAAGPDPGPDAGREPGTASRRGRGKRRGLGGLLLPGLGCERPGRGCCVFISERPVGGAAGRSCGISLDSPRFQANAPFLNGRSAVRCPPHAGATAQTGTPWLLCGARVAGPCPLSRLPGSSRRNHNLKEAISLSLRAQKGLNSGQNEGETYSRLNIDLECKCQEVGEACMSSKWPGDFPPSQSLACPKRKAGA